MRTTPYASGWKAGRRREEARRDPHVPGAPPPPPAEGATLQGLLQAGKTSSASGSGGVASYWGWAGPVEWPHPLATESERAGAKEHSEYESTSGPVGVLFPAGATGLQEQRQQVVPTPTAFTSEQVEILEEVFTSRNTLTVSESLRLAASLGMREDQVRFWFQNRRMRLQRNDLDNLVQLPGPILPYAPEVQPSFSQNFPMYPPLIVRPVVLYSGLRYSLHRPVYQPPQNPPYQILDPGLMYPFPPQLSVPPDTQYASAFKPFNPAE